MLLHQEKPFCEFFRRTFIQSRCVVNKDVRACNLRDVQGPDANGEIEDVLMVESRVAQLYVAVCRTDVLRCLHVGRKSMLTLNLQGFVDGTATVASQ